MKNKCIKMLATLVLSIITFNFIGNNSFALKDLVDEEIKAGVTAIYQVADTKTTSTASTAEKRQEEEMMKNASSLFGDSALGKIASGIVGIIYTSFLVVIPSSLGYAAQTLASATANSAGTMEKGDNTLVSPEQILFNRIAITDINFFQMNSFGSNKTPLTGSNNPIKVIRESIANWYYALRIIAVIILLCILIYIGIRMAMSTIAEDKAKYKQWLWNWVVSMALLFALHYLIIVVISVNSAFVDLLYNAKGAILSGGGTDIITSYVKGLMENAFNTDQMLIGLTSVLVYLGIVIFTFVFLIIYIKRMITIAFLILISPIITITYSIDKIKDNTSQALNTWLREFMENVLIQPFHCIIYLAFIAVTMSLMRSAGTLAAGLLCIMTMFFVFKAESIVKNIFGIKAEASGNGFATAAAMFSVYKATGGFVKKNSKAPDTGKPGKDSKGSNPNTALVATTNNGTKSTNTGEKNMKNVDKTNTNTNSSKNINANEYLKPNRDVRGNSSELSDALYNANEAPMTEDASDARTGEIEGVSRTVYTGRPSKTDNTATNDNQNLNSNDKLRLAVQNAKNRAVYGNSSSRSSELASNEINNMPNGTSNETMDIQDNIDQEEKRTISKPSSSYAGKAWSMAKTAAGASFALSTAMAGAMMTGIAGKDLGEIIAAGVAGKVIGSDIVDKVGEVADSGKNRFDNFMHDRTIKNRERDLATEYNRYKNENKLDDKKMAEHTQRFRKMSDKDINGMKSETAKSYARALKAMPNIYAENGRGDDPNQELADVLRRIKNGEVKPNNSKK